jgi:protein-S-isoprenylcysteine O-methyltransferase Ste14
MPAAVPYAGDALVALGLAIVWRVFRANTFTSAVVDVERAQTVVSTGPYAIVRHPMYAGALLMLAGTPPALGSWWGLVAVAVLGAVVVARLLDEEGVLGRDLAGYDAYRARVRYRLIPGVW